MSFNLNLLECKLRLPPSSVTLAVVLISTYWNVNSRDSALYPNCLNVLISTYWNVNQIHSLSLPDWVIVLISTYWNVN